MEISIEPVYKGASILAYIRTILAHGYLLVTDSMRRASKLPKYDEAWTRLNISAIGNDEYLLLVNISNENRGN